MQTLAGPLPAEGGAIGGTEAASLIPAALNGDGRVAAVMRGPLGIDVIAAPEVAEQLAAMGKISEIIGKRSQNITGEATIDVQSTSQQLRTGYQDRKSEHVQAGAEINRDEIPVALENYVTQYFEQVRKQAPAKK